MPKVLQSKDLTDNFVINKDILPSIPFRFLLVGRSGSGKSSILNSLIALDENYGKDFKGENIYIWSGSKSDPKMSNLIGFKEIPDGNVRNTWLDGEVSGLYEELLENWREKLEEKETPPSILFIVDDLFFSNQFRSEGAKNSMMNKIYQNGRKFHISIIILAQKFSSISTCVRENANSIITFGATNKQIDLMESDFNYLDNKQQFFEVFRTATIGSKHDFLFINIDLPIENRYMGSDFQPIKITTEEK